VNPAQERGGTGNPSIGNPRRPKKHMSGKRKDSQSVTGKASCDDESGERGPACV